MGDGTGRYRYQQDRVESALVLVDFCDYGSAEEIGFIREKEVSSVQQLAVI
jgi:hypothetical protein